MNAVKKALHQNPSVNLRSGYKKRLCSAESYGDGHTLVKHTVHVGNSFKAHFASHMVSLYLVFCFHVEDWNAHLGNMAFQQEKHTQENCLCSMWRHPMPRRDSRHLTMCHLCFCENWLSPLNLHGENETRHKLSVGSMVDKDMERM